MCTNWDMVAIDSLKPSVSLVIQSSDESQVLLICVVVSDINIVWTPDPSHQVSKGLGNNIAQKFHTRIQRVHKNGQLE